MTNVRSRVAVTLDLHTQRVDLHLVECRCGWVARRGPAATAAWHGHLTDVLTAALTNL